MESEDFESEHGTTGRVLTVGGAVVAATLAAVALCYQPVWGSGSTSEPEVVLSWPFAFGGYGSEGGAVVFAMTPAGTRARLFIDEERGRLTPIDLQPLGRVVDRVSGEKRTLTAFDVGDERMFLHDSDARAVLRVEPSSKSAEMRRPMWYAEAIPDRADAFIDPGAAGAAPPFPSTRGVENGSGVFHAFPNGEQLSGRVAVLDHRRVGKRDVLRVGLRAVRRESSRRSPAAARPVEVTSELLSLRAGEEDRWSSSASIETDACGTGEFELVVPEADAAGPVGELTLRLRHGERGDGDEDGESETSTRLRYRPPLASPRLVSLERPTVAVSFPAAGGLTDRDEPIALANTGFFDTPQAVAASVGHFRVPGGWTTLDSAQLAAVDPGTRLELSAEGTQRRAALLRLVDDRGHVRARPLWVVENSQALLGGGWPDEGCDRRRLAEMMVRGWIEEWRIGLQDSGYTYDGRIDGVGPGYEAAFRQRAHLGSFAGVAGLGLLGLVAIVLAGIGVYLAWYADDEDAPATEPDFWYALYACSVATAALAVSWNHLPAMPWVLAFLAGLVGITSWEMPSGGRRLWIWNGLVSSAVAGVGAYFAAFLPSAVVHGYLFGSAFLAIVLLLEGARWAWRATGDLDVEIVWGDAMVAATPVTFCMAVAAGMYLALG